MTLMTELLHLEWFRPPIGAGSDFPGLRYWILYLLLLLDRTSYWLLAVTPSLHHADRLCPCLQTTRFHLQCPMDAKFALALVSRLRSLLSTGNGQFLFVSSTLSRRPTGRIARICYFTVRRPKQRPTEDNGCGPGSIYGTLGPRAFRFDCFCDHDHNLLSGLEKSCLSPSTPYATGI